MKTKSLIFIVILFTFFVNKSWSATIIVAPSGGNYASVQAGVNAANAGDTVLVKAGTYNETVTFPKSGYINNNITLFGETGAIIDGTGKNGQAGITISSKNYIRVIGMEIQNFKGSGNNSTPMGIYVTGSSGNLEILNNKVHNIDNDNGNAHGIAFYGTSSTPINNIVVDSNEIFNCKLGQSESLVLNGNITNFTVSSNIIHDNDNIGIDFIGFEGTGPKGYDQARDGVCSDNTVYNISSQYNPTYGGDRSADGIYVDGGRNIIIEKNHVYNNDIGIELASEHKGKSTQDIIVRNNFVSGSFLTNIMAGGYNYDKGNAFNIAIVNNTTYKGRQGEVALQFNCDTIIIKNNIFYGETGQAYLQDWGRGNTNTNISVNNNIYYGGSTSSPGAWSDSNAKYVNPKLVNPPANMHLKSGSPAINAGINLGNDSNGNPVSGEQDIDNQNRIANGIIDIGADEYQPATGINDQQFSSLNLNIFPNPATYFLNIENKSKDNLKITVDNMEGKQIIVINSKKESKENIKLASWNPGMYILYAVADNHQLVGIYRVLKLRTSATTVFQ